jgi:nicotinamidase-related amidase
MRALVIIDIQNEYADGGMYALPRFAEAAEQAAVAIAAARSAGIPVVHVRHEIVAGSEWGFVPGTHGAAIHDAVAPVAGEAVIVKNHPNSFLQTNLRELLDALGEGPVAFAGMMTSTCVDSTVRAASDAGLDAVLVADACAAPGLEHDGLSVDADAVNAAFLAALGEDFAELRAANALTA